MLAATLRQLLYRLQKVAHRSVFGKFRIYRESLWLLPVCIITVDDTKQHLLVIVVFCQEIAIYTDEEGIFREVLLPTKGFHCINTNTHLARQFTCLYLCTLSIRYQLTEGLAAIKVLSIPLLAFRIFHILSGYYCKLKNVH